MKMSAKTFLLISALASTFPSLLWAQTESENKNRDSSTSHGMPLKMDVDMNTPLKNIQSAIHHMEGVVKMMQKMYDNIEDMKNNTSDPKVKKQIEGLQEDMGKMMQHMQDMMEKMNDNMEFMLKAMPKSEIKEQMEKMHKNLGQMMRQMNKLTSHPSGQDSQQKKQ